MSWNRSTYSKPKSAPKRGVSVGRGILAGCIVVSLGIAAILLFRTGGEEPKDSPPAEKKIRQVEPKKPPRTNAAPAPAESEKPPKPLKPQRVGEIRDGKMLMVDGRLRKMSKHVVTAEVARVAPVFRTPLTLVSCCGVGQSSRTKDCSAFKRPFRSGSANLLVKSFKLIWGHIVTMAVNPDGVVEGLNVLEDQGASLSVSLNAEAV